MRSPITRFHTVILLITLASCVSPNPGRSGRDTGAGGEGGDDGTGGAMAGKGGGGAGAGSGGSTGGAGGGVGGGGHTGGAGGQVGGTGGYTGGAGGQTGGAGGQGTGGSGTGGAGLPPDAGPPPDTACPGACCAASECPMKANQVASCDLSTHTCKYTCAPTAKDCGGGRCIPGGAGACCNDGECGDCKRCSADKCANTTNGQNGPGCSGECKACNNGSCGNRSGSCGQGATCMLVSGVGSRKAADQCSGGTCDPGAVTSCAPYGCSSSSCATSCPSWSEIKSGRCSACGGNGEGCCITLSGKCKSGYTCADAQSGAGSPSNICLPCGGAGQFCCPPYSPNDAPGYGSCNGWTYCGMGGAGADSNFGCIRCGGGAGAELPCASGPNPPCRSGYHLDANTNTCIP